MVLDEIDRKIIRILQADGRLSNVQLAEKIGMSPSPVLERVRKLERSGVIAGYAARVDPAAAGVNLFAYVAVCLDLGMEDAHRRFEEALRPLPEVLECHRLGGDDRYLLKVAVADIAAYDRFVVDVLAPHPTVRDIDSSFVLSTAWEGRPLPIEGVREIPILED